MVIQKTRAREIAEELVDWFQDYDVYEYNDTVDDILVYLDELTAQIEAGDSKELFDYLEEAIEEGDEYDRIIIRAKKLLRKLQNYKA